MDGLRAIVTGGAGFIGSNLVLELERRFDANILVIDNLLTGSHQNLAGFKGDLIAEDVESERWVDKVKDRPFDAIFHLASITDTTVHDQKKMMTNVQGFRTVLDLARRREIPVVYASSAAVYGNAPARMSETQPSTPANIYGFSKMVMENLARDSASRVRSVGLRYFNVFGPREGFKGPAASMISQLARQMISGKRPRVFKMGEQKRDFIYVKDVVEITIRALSAAETTVLNAGTGKATSFNEVIQHLNKALGTKLEPDYFDNPYTAFYQNVTLADVRRLKQILGTAPQHSTEAGILEYAPSLR